MLRRKDSAYLAVGGVQSLGSQVVGDCISVLLQALVGGRPVGVQHS